MASPSERKNSITFGILPIVSAEERAAAKKPLDAERELKKKLGIVAADREQSWQREDREKKKKALSARIKKVWYKNLAKVKEFFKRKVS